MARSNFGLECVTSLLLPLTAISLMASMVLFIVFCRAIYNCFLHPLASFPGPRLWAASRLPYVLCLWEGRLHEQIKCFHDKYGPVVRIAPDELSFIVDEAWNDIYCGGNANKGFPKHFAYRNAQTFESLFDAPDDNHTRLRRLLKTDFFSMRAARRQERVVLDYTSRLISQLRENHCRVQHSKDEEGTEKIFPPADLRQWYNFATFDIIGRVTLSEDFGCLDGKAYHPWIIMVLTHFKLSALLMCLRFYPPLPSILSYIAPVRLLRLQHKFLALVREKVGRRCLRTLDPGEEDFITAALKQRHHGREFDNFAESSSDDRDANVAPLSQLEIEANSTLLLLAGSETMATSLLSATHLLCENPTAMRRLVTEVRTVASTESDIDFANTTAKMPYLNAVLRETHRLCPPLANGPSRMVGKQGAIIAGWAVPPGTAVGVTQYAANRCATNFDRPEDFLPERWLSPEVVAKYGIECDHNSFAQDKREVVRPFSAGGRDCLGQNLAWVEFRVLLARMIWNFDIEVCRGDQAQINHRTGTDTEPFAAFRRWTEQKAFMLWQKEAYHVWLSARN
ncbi:cytochrome P450 [Hypoxylon sp. FL0890]|nr:cytochrome P450 [Hypoxylon sp. FL0890]